MQEPDRRTKADQKPEEAKRPPNSAPDPIALMIPRQLSVKAGSGTILMYALDQKGDGILVDPAKKNGPWKEVDVDRRWVAITGVLDNQAIREAEARARKIELAQAYPDYKRFDIERQARNREGHLVGLGTHRSREEL